MNIRGRRPAIFQCKTNKMSGLDVFLKDGRGDDVKSVSFRMYHGFISKLTVHVLPQ
jgi:hypothetical protein